MSQSKYHHRRASIDELLSNLLEENKTIFHKKEISHPKTNTITI
jgi:hypothetical protein